MGLANIGRGWLVLVVALLALAAPAVASAATRYADPAGTSTDPCTQSSPCDIVTAINSATAGDTVIVNSGTYGSAATPLTTALNAGGTSLTIQGAGSGVARPVIYDDSAADALTIAGSASDLDVENPNGGTAVLLLDGATASRIVANGGSQGCTFDGAGSLLDSVCRSPAGSAVDTSPVPGAVLRNDTAVGVEGLDVGPGNAMVINSILQGTTVDVGDPSGVATLTDDEFTSDPGTPPGNITGQVTARPQFVNAAAGDYHEAAGAPSIDTGTDDPANGAADLDGNLRKLGTHTDIGAYEYVAAPTATATAATGVMHTALTLNGTLDAGGSPASYHFAYGTSSGSLTSSTPTQTLMAATGSQEVSATPTGLTAGTTYYYALVVDTNGGDVTSATTSASTSATATRYADPSGTANAACTQAQPCDIVTAINDADVGDTVIVNSGTYGSSASPLSSRLNPGGTSLTVRGANAGAQRPVLYVRSSSGLTVAGSASDLDVEETSNGFNTAIVFDGGATGTRLIAHSFASAGDGCQVSGANVTVIDSLCRSDSSNSGLAMEGSSATTLRNDTLIGSFGLFNNGGTATVVNSILSGPRDDLVSTAGGVTLTNSEFSKTSGNAFTSTGQVTDPPQFVDAAAGDYHEAAGAPSIDAGTTTGDGAPYDLDGNLRWIGSAPDIGAYESPRAVAPGVSANPPTGIGPTSATFNGTVDNFGEGTSYHFAYGLNPGQLSSSTPTRTAFGAAGDVALSAQVTGLTPGTTYYYKLVVTTTGGGTSTSGYVSFIARAPETRFAAPNGTASTDCVQATPCDITTAINQAQDGDTVTVNGGSYGSAASPALSGVLNASGIDLTIEGATTGSARPVIYSSAAAGLVVTGTTSDLDVEDGAPGAAALVLRGRASASRLIGYGSGYGCAISGAEVLTDSICRSDPGASSVGLVVRGNGSTLRNDTFVGGDGIDVENSTVTGANCIFAGGTDDIYLNDNGAQLTLTNSEYRADSVAKTGSATLSSTNPVLAAPVFVNAAAGDFHEASGSPSIDAGVDDPANGSTDLDGNPRQLGSHTDNGAYEFIPAPTATTTPATALSTTAATLNGALTDAGVPASYHFVYGTSASSLTSSTPSQPVPAGAASQSVSAALTGLTPGTTYSYVLVVTSAGGTVTSATDSFTTPYPTTVPSIAIASPTPGTAYTMGAVVPAAYSCTDRSGAGIATCSGPVVPGADIDTSTAGPHTFTVTATDKAGNQANSTVDYTVISPAAPTLTITTPASKARYVRYAHVTARYACADGVRGPGLASCSAPVASGRSLSTSALGRHTFTVTAVSRDGLRTHRTIAYTVVAPDNRFTVSHITTPGDGTVGFTVTVPGRGLLEALASEWNDNFARVARIPLAPRRSAYGSVASRLHRSGTYAFVLRPNTAGRRLIAHHRYWPGLRLVVQFTPTGGYARRLGFFHVHPLPRPRPF